MNEQVCLDNDVMNNLRYCLLALFLLFIAASSIFRHSIWFDANSLPNIYPTFMKMAQYIHEFQKKKNSVMFLPNQALFLNLAGLEQQTRNQKNKVEYSTISCVLLWI